MPMSRLTAVITALMLSGWSHEACAKYNLRQLQVIEQLILDKDCGALLRYLAENPELMAGEDELARELRSFVDNVDGRIIQSISLKSDADCNPVELAENFELR